MSSNLGSIFYIPQKIPLKIGFEVEITTGVELGIPVAKGLPDVIDMTAVLVNASTALGKQIFNKCAICHTIEKGEANKIGPNLWNILGAPTARHKEFTYSPAM